MQDTAVTKLAAQIPPNKCPRRAEPAWKSSLTFLMSRRFCSRVLYETDVTCSIWHQPFPLNMFLIFTWALFANTRQRSNFVISILLYSRPLLFLVFDKTDGGCKGPILEPISREINRRNPGETRCLKFYAAAPVGIVPRFVTLRTASLS